MKKKYICEEFVECNKKARIEKNEATLSIVSACKYVYTEYKDT